jgi:hypothetical protein
MRVSLRSFLVCSAVLGAVIGLTVRWYFTQQYVFETKNHRIAVGPHAFDTIRLRGAWRRNGFGEETLLYMVAIPPGESLVCFSQPCVTDNPTLQSPLRKGLSVFPDGLYFDGDLVPQSDQGKVWLFTERLEMLNLEPNRSDTSSARFDTFEETETWKSGVLAAVRKEAEDK